MLSNYCKMGGSFPSRKRGMSTQSTCWQTRCCNRRYPCSGCKGFFILEEDRCCTYVWRFPGNLVLQRRLYIFIQVSTVDVPESREFLAAQEICDSSSGVTSCIVMKNDGILYHQVCDYDLFPKMSVCVCPNANPLHYYVLWVPHRKGRWC